MVNSHINRLIEMDLHQICREIASDPLLVQGAGGNVSVKVEDTLRVKASGQRMDEAKTKNIFVDINLNSYRENFALGLFEQLSVITSGENKPSIETAMHALLPTKFVLHIHMVDAISYLVRKDAKKALEKRLQPNLTWDVLPYLKPGIPLGLGVQKLVKNKSAPEVIFLKNHGIVISADTKCKLLRILEDLIFCLKREPRKFEQQTTTDFQKNVSDYILCSEDWMHKLSLIPELYMTLKSSWALYPDHIVFLGPRPALCFDNLPNEFFVPFVFDNKSGTYMHRQVKRAHIEQLRCYFDVISRVSKGTALDTISEKEIQELISWDAESHRIALAK